MPDDDNKDDPSAAVQDPAQSGAQDQLGAAAAGAAADSGSQGETPETPAQAVEPSLPADWWDQPHVQEYLRSIQQQAYTQAQTDAAVQEERKRIEEMRQSGDWEAYGKYMAEKQDEAQRLALASQQAQYAVAQRIWSDLQAMDGWKLLTPQEQWEILQAPSGNPLVVAMNKIKEKEVQAAIEKEAKEKVAALVEAERNKALAEMHQQSGVASPGATSPGPSEPQSWAEYFAQKDKARGTV